MAVTLNMKPLPPPRSLREKIAALQVGGESLWTDEHAERVVRVTASRAKADCAGRAKFKIAKDDGGVRVWRVA